MKKLHYAFLLIAMSLVSTYSFGQMAIDKGTTFVNAGIGVGGYSSAGGVALGAGADFGIAPNITAGGQVAYRSFNYGYLGINDKINYLYFAARGSYHFNEILKLNMKELDLYAGIGLGYERVSYSSSYGSSFSTFGSGIFVPVHIGARYFFSEKIGGVAELGSGIAPLFLGITFKLK